MVPLVVSGLQFQTFGRGVRGLMGKSGGCKAGGAKAMKGASSKPSSAQAEIWVEGCLVIAIGYGIFNG